MHSTLGVFVIGVGTLFIALAAGWVAYEHREPSDSEKADVEFWQELNKHSSL